MSFYKAVKSSYSALRTRIVGLIFVAFLLGVSSDAYSWISCWKFDQFESVTIAESDKDRFFSFAQAAGKIDIRRLDQVRLIAKFDDSCRRSICLYILVSEVSGRSISFLSTGTFLVCLSCTGRSAIDGRPTKGISVVGEKGAFDIYFENEGRDFVIMPVDLGSSLQFCPNR